MVGNKLTTMANATLLAVFAPVLGRALPSARALALRNGATPSDDLTQRGAPKGKKAGSPRVAPDETAVRKAAVAAAANLLLAGRAAAAANARLRTTERRTHDPAHPNSDALGLTFGEIELVGGDEADEPKQLQHTIVALGKMVHAEKMGAGATMTTTNNSTKYLLPEEIALLKEWATTRTQLSDAPHEVRKFFKPDVPELRRVFKKAKDACSVWKADNDSVRAICGPRPQLDAVCEEASQWSTSLQKLHDSIVEGEKNLADEEAVDLVRQKLASFLEMRTAAPVKAFDEELSQLTAEKARPLMSKGLGTVFQEAIHRCKWLEAGLRAEAALRHENRLQLETLTLQAALRHEDQRLRLDQIRRLKTALREASQRQPDELKEGDPRKLVAGKKGGVLNKMTCVRRLLPFRGSSGSSKIHPPPPLEVVAAEVVGRRKPRLRTRFIGEA